LPKLNLPTFSGKYDEWFPFFDFDIQLDYPFQHLTLKYAKISVSMGITGDANAVISSLSDANYDVASILRDRYDNKRVIVQTHVNSL